MQPRKMHGWVGVVKLSMHITGWNSHVRRRAIGLSEEGYCEPLWCQKIHVDCDCTLGLAEESAHPGHGGWILGWVPCMNKKANGTMNTTECPGKEGGERVRHKVFK
jgi:hypothetical protein